MTNKTPISDINNIIKQVVMKNQTAWDKVAKAAKVMEDGFNDNIHWNLCKFCKKETNNFLITGKCICNNCYHDMEQNDYI